MENTFIFQTSPEVTIGTNKFINVPVILKYEDTNLIEVIKEENVGYTTKIPIYHNDGTKLAQVIGNRLYTTKSGKKAGLSIEKHQGLWVCKMEQQTLFEIEHGTGDFFKTNAELYTPDGYFIKCAKSHIPDLINTEGNPLQINGMIMSENTFNGCNVGIWIRKNGSCAIGVNG